MEELNPKFGPVSVFYEGIYSRHKELLFLADSFRQGMELIADLEHVNEILRSSPRPDLVMTERLEMMPVESPSKLGRINNFVPNLCGFGVPLFEDQKQPGFASNELKRTYIGRRTPTEEERAQYFLIGARGNYHKQLEFAKENGVDEELARDMILMTHIDKEAFMRMWILMPELTAALMAACLDTPGSERKNIKEEVFVAYALMSRLVDRNDARAVKKDGSIDPWLLCH